MKPAVQPTPAALDESAAQRHAIAVVTDSTADLPAHVLAEHNVTVVPLSVTIGDETFQDGVLSQAEFFERMYAAPRLPTTSQPSVGAFVEAYRAALETAATVVSIHVSEHLSGTIQSARQAAAEFGGRVHVIDSLNLSYGLGFQVIEAARHVAAGASLPAVVAAVERVRDRVQLIIGLDSLDNLARGGRIGRVSAFMGGMLDLKVLLRVENGVFQPVARVRGLKGSMAKALDWVEQQLPPSRAATFCVLHAMAPATAEKLRDSVSTRFAPRGPVELAETGIVIATHTGSGWAVAFVPE